MKGDTEEPFSQKKLSELFESAGQNYNEFLIYMRSVVSAFDPPLVNAVAPLYALWTIGYSIEEATKLMHRQSGRPTQLIQ